MNRGPRPMPFQPPQGELALLAGTGNPMLAQQVAEALGSPLLPCEALHFSDSNVFVRVLENVRGKDCYIVQGVHARQATSDAPACSANDAFMELLFWIDALKRASAQTVTAVIPYFSYAKGDKKDEPRVSIRARVCADAIEAAGADRVLTMDLHSPQIQGFFRIPVDHLYGRHILCDAVVEHGFDGDDIVVCAPDVGFAKGAASFANLLGAAVAIGHKERASHDENAEVLQVVGDVEGKRVLIVDDFTISGGTLVSMANRLVDAGAAEVSAAISHAILSDSAASKLADSVLKRVYFTDTVEPMPTPFPKKFVSVSSAPLFATAIRSIHDRTSVSQLFEEQS